MSNPLVAAKQDSTTWHSGINVIDDAASAYEGISSGSWIEGGIGALGAGLDVLTMAMNPVGTLISYGLNWLIEHVKPLQDALNQLAGDADQIAAYAQTWKNVAAAVDKAAKDLAAGVAKETAHWTGSGADAYRANLKEKTDHLGAASTCAAAVGTVVEIVGVITGAVRMLVRDMVTQAVGDFIQDALEEVCSLGLGTPVVVAQVVEQVSAWVEKIGAVIKKLINSVEKLRPLMSKLEEIFAAVKKAMAALHGRAGGEEPHLGGEGTHPSSAEGTHATGPEGSGDPRPGSLRDDAANPADRAQEPTGRCGRKEPVDAATGEMFMVQTDVELPGVLPLVLRRTHVSSYRSGRLFGPSWSSTLDQRLEFDEQGVCFAGPDGVILVYPLPPAAGATVLPVVGSRWPLGRSADGGYVLSQPETGRTLHFPPPEDGLAPLAVVADRRGNRIEFDRDSDGVPTAVRHSGGYRVAVDSEDGRVTGLRLVNGPGDEIALTGFGYAGARLTSVTNSSGQAMRFSYDGAGRVVRWDDRIGEWYAYTYDHEGRCVRTDGAGDMLTGAFEYDTANRITRETDSLGNVSTYHFDELHQLTREVDPLGNETRYEWDGLRRLASRTDPTGRTTRHAYDDDGNLVAVTRPDGSQSLAEYNDFRQPVTVVQPDGGIWRRTYTAAGDLASVTDPAGATIRYSYDARGFLAAITDPAGGTKRIETDAAGLPVRVTGPRGEVSTCTRDRFGRIATFTDAGGNTTRLAWTVEGRLLSRTLPGGACERWRYDAEGGQTERVDALGNRTRVELTHFGLPKVRTEADGSRLEYEYDTELRILAVRNALGLTWRYEYDAAGRLVSETDFNGRMLRYERDGAGRVERRTNGAGESTVFVRDALGAVVERRSADVVTTFGYDEMGRLSRAANGDAEVVFERDALGRVLAETVNGRTLRSEFDVAGRRIARTTPTGKRSVWEYDASHRPTALRTGGHVMSFGYDQAGHEIERLLDTGTVLAQAWDADHRLLSQTVSAATGGSAQPRLVQRRAYHYRPDGLLTGIDDELAGPSRFELDQAGRVTGVSAAHGVEQYAYAPTGVLAASALPGEMLAPREFDGALLRSSGGLRYRHDAQGRVVLRQRKRLSAKPATWHYRWDSEDRLVGVTTPDGTRWRYRYDPLGRRIAKQRLGPDGAQVAEQVDFVWDGSTLAEQVHNGSAATTWDWAPGGRQPVSQTQRDRGQEWVDRQFYSIVTDLVGTAAELVDEQGNVAWRRQSSLWGEMLGRRTDRATTPLRFPGQYFDAESGLHYNYHRYYDPAAGQYVSHDPLGFAPSPNTQGYVVNPTGWIDPFGLEGCTFGNQQPESLDAEREVMRRNGVTPTTPGTPEFDAMINSGDGQLKWVVTDSGELRVAPHTVNGDEISHAAIADGSRVRAAGQANVAGGSDAGYFGLEIDNHSGHYFHGVEHDGDAVIQEGVDAFGRYGVPDTWERSPVGGG
ncbi:DUF6531 domain-containing protein [Amycolatopsis sp. cg13]|uniref:DUF6531 domain-containing protein n=1 Tax=Amycolatopsis sp. cg13 TaxID=3238807 RepID=UPI003526BBF2